MCGIIGYLGSNNAPSKLEKYLKALEYRGYDSAGIAVYNEDEKKIKVKKTIGTIDNISYEIKNEINGNIGIAHTRWATHGKINIENTHPHISTDKKIVLVHNGILENYIAIKNELKKEGYNFYSETDSEVLVKLIEFNLKENDLSSSLNNVLKKITGSSTIVGMHEDHPGSIFIIKKGNSGGLIICQNKDGDKIISSDPSIVSDFASSYRYLVDNEIALITKDKNDFIIEESDPKSREVPIKNNTLIHDESDYQFKMEEEIFYQPKALRRLINEKKSLIIDKLESSSLNLKNVNRILLVGMGSSFHSALLGSMYFEEVSNIKSEAVNSSEFVETKKVIGLNDLVIGITQSGETAETIKALEFAKLKGAATLAVVEKNMSQASIICEATVNIGTGPEYSVASTKTFTSSVIALYIISVIVAEKKEFVSNKSIEKYYKVLESLPSSIEYILNNSEAIKKIVENLSTQEHILYLGRGLFYPIALEGALKMKEVCYIHAEGYPAGEMKHGVNALIGDKMPSIVLSPKNSTYSKMISTINEIKARDGDIIGIVNDSDNEITTLLTKHLTIKSIDKLLDPILFVIPLQLISYYCSLRLKINPDRPRNLAKTVTVE